MCLLKKFSSHTDIFPRLKVNFCEEILPQLLSLLVQTKKSSATEVYKAMNSFLEKHFPDNNSSPQCDFQSVQLFLNLAQRLRECEDTLANFQLCYSSLARAARFAGAYFSSIFYAEYACHQLILEKPGKMYMHSLNDMSRIDEERGSQLQCILHESFIKIGESDLVHGCKTLPLEKSKSHMKYLYNPEECFGVIQSEDVNLTIGKHNEQSEQSLKKYL